MWATFALLGATVLWGVWGVAEKEAVNRANPFMVQFLAMLHYVATAPLWYWLSARNGASQLPDQRTILWGVTGGAAATLALLLLLLALQTRPASSSVAVTAAYPLVTLLLAVWMGTESLTATKLIGIVLVIAGVLVAQSSHVQ